MKINVPRLEYLYFSGELGLLSPAQMVDLFAGVALQSRETDPVLGGPFPSTAAVLRLLFCFVVIHFVFCQEMQKYIRASPPVLHEDELPPFAGGIRMVSLCNTTGR